MDELNIDTLRNFLFFDKQPGNSESFQTDQTVHYKVARIKVS